MITERGREVITLKWELGAGTYLPIGIRSSVKKSLFIINSLTTASQMWLLARSLPLIIGSCVPSDDNHWKNYCLFVSITRILFAPRLNEDDLAKILQPIIKNLLAYIPLIP